MFINKFLKVGATILTTINIGLDSTSKAIKIYINRKVYNVICRAGLFPSLFYVFKIHLNKLLNLHIMLLIITWQIICL